MVALTELLLNAQPQAQEHCDLLQLQVLRHSAFQSNIRSKNGDVVIRLDKPRPFNPFCGIHWQLSDAINGGASGVTARAALFSCTMSFEADAGAKQTTMVQTSDDPASYIVWKDITYRWDSVSSLAPLHLQLINTATRQIVAQLQGSRSMPWSQEQQQISISAGMEDPVWLQVIIASGLAEAKRLGGESSFAAPRRFAMR